MEANVANIAVEQEAARQEQLAEFGRIHPEELVLVEIDAATLEQSYGRWMVYVFVGIETPEIELP